MQVSIISLTILGIGILLLLVSEGMIRKLTHGAKIMQNSLDIENKGTISFRFFLRAQYLWYLSYILLWFAAGYFFAISLSIADGLLIAMFIMFFYFLGEGRRSRSWKLAEQIRVRTKWIRNWDRLALYKSLIDSGNYRLLEIINDIDRLENLERTAKHTKRVASYDTKKMCELFSREKIEPKLREHLRFLMSDDSSEKHTIEEIYVILFILSAGSNEVSKIAQDMLSSDLNKILVETE